MSHALIKDNKVQSFPYTKQQLKTDNPNVSFPNNVDMDSLQEYGVVSVEMTEQPSFDRYTQEAVYKIEEVDGQWKQVWTVNELSDATKQSNLEKRIKDYISVLENHQNEMAQTKSYYDRISCSLRAGFEGPYKEEGVAFARWMDNCNFIAYAILDQMKTGEREWMSTDDFIGVLPTCTWDERDSINLNLSTYISQI